MNVWAFIVLLGGWTLALGLAVFVVHVFTEARWRRRAEARTFDMMVERYRQQKF